MQVGDWLETVKGITGMFTAWLKLPLFSDLLQSSAL
jgi:hypothetical protein